MKKTFRFVSLMWLALLASLIGSVAEAQNLPPLPRDTAVRVGQLDNGLTYFIRHNKHPEGRADFYIAQRVGSMQEEENQRGLAHFLEHMAFNGSKHFPGKGMINWLETIGVRFGSNLNAYTAFDETVYTIKDVPVERRTVVDSCILILKDWSHGITLEDQEIDNERGVIQEEERARNSGNLRVMEAVLAKAFPDNLYGKRMPIGLMEVVRNFKYDELRDYYKKWYRPDLQALVIVGDIDPDAVEATIKRLFADVPKPVGAAERVYVEVADHKGILPIVATDPEASTTRFSLSFKMPALSRELKETQVGIAMDYIMGMITAMANQRLTDISKKPNAPYLYAGASYGSFQVAQTKDALTFGVIANDGQYLPAMRAVIAEMERIRQHGFTASEYKRAVDNYLASVKASYNERDKRKNEAFATSYANYYTQGGNLLDIESFYTLAQALADQIPVEAINATVQGLGEDNIMVSLTGPAKEGIVYPTEEALAEQVRAARAVAVEPYKDAVSDAKLLKETPKAGKVVKVDKQGKFGSTIWTLSNGARVVLLPTTHKDDEIRLSAYRPGGYYLYDDNPADLQVARSLGSVISLGGLAEFDDSALTKVLSGRMASARPYIDGTSIGISGSSTKEDLETMLQLVYLNFTAKRSDTDAFASYQEKEKGAIKMREKNPMGSLRDSIAALSYGADYLYGQSLKAEEVDKIDYARSMQIYRELFGNAYGFTFYLVGNIEEARLKPLVETYLASLPSRKQSYKRHEEKVRRMLTGKRKIHYTQQMEKPMGVVLNLWGGQVPVSQTSEIAMEVIGEVLQQIYFETLREEEGGTYGASARAVVSYVPKDEAQMMVFFQTDPAKADELNAIVKRELDKVLKEGLPKDKFDKVIANLEKNYTEGLKENGYWLALLGTYYTHGRDEHSDYLKALRSLTPEMLRAQLASFVKQGNYHELIMRPETATK